MKYSLPKKALQYVEDNFSELIDLTITIAQIPAPSHKEEKRADFCLNWLSENGAEGVYIDQALNVIYPVNCDGKNDLTVFMAHMDIVFPETEPLTVHKKDGKIFAPGIGDDTANLAVLLMVAKYVAAAPDAIGNAGILFVANSCEEGLGGLKGCKQIMQSYKGRIARFYSFDGYISQITNDAVGSERFEVTVHSQGGHSYFDFGNQNAIYCLAQIIDELYQIKVPSGAKTTYNVGRIEGGTTVNTIAQKASMLFEYRSLDAENLKQMKSMFSHTIGKYKNMGTNIEVRLLDSRPCKDGVDDESLHMITKKSKEIIRQYYDGPLKIAAASTDSNIPLSLGIPANTIGTVIGGGGHTYEEWINPGSLKQGLSIAMTVILNADKP